jgi:hypothetical protein
MTRKRGFNKKFLIAIFALINFLSISLFVFQYNASIKENYQFSQYEKQREQLLRNNEELSINFVEANNYKNLEAIAQRFNFEKGGNIHYITVMSGMASK